MNARVRFALLIVALLSLLLILYCPRPGPTGPGPVIPPGSTVVVPGSTVVVPGSTVVVPPPVLPPAGSVVQLAGGLEHTCALLRNGDVYCWGSSPVGQLGYGNTDTIGDDETPASAGPVDVGGTVTQITSGNVHTCVLLTTGRVRCWGGRGGRLGYGHFETIGDDELPSSAGDIDVGSSVTQIAAGSIHTCALLTGGSVRCWGRNLGYGNTETIGDDELPFTAGDIDVGGTVTQIAAGGDHTCALLIGGRVRCWGSAFNGQLGYGNTNRIGDNETPDSAGDVDVGGNVAQIAVNGNHTCARLDTGAVRCWGAAREGQLGYGNIDEIGDDETPSSVGDVNIGGAASRIWAGAGHNCVMLSTGGLRCWGEGTGGRLGYGNTNRIGDNETPATVGLVDVGTTVTEVAAAGEHTCAVTSGGTVRCWGRGGRGALGYANTDDIGDDELPATAGDVSVP